MSAAIPITLQAVPVNVGVAPANLNELLTLVASQLTAFISTTVSFYAQGAAVPSAFVTSLFFNTSNGFWYYWDTGSGKYLVQTTLIQGDTKTSFVSGDNTNIGWIQLNGRVLTAIPGISAKQLAVLQSLFGSSGTLPTVQPIQSLVNLPATGAFSEITNPSVTPAAGVFAGLTVNNPPAQADVQAITANAETLDDSVATLQAAVASIITESEAVLDSLNGGANTPLYTFVYCGAP